MGYAHINNLYKDQRILDFPECYALEKIHGTSAHVSIDAKKIKFFAGGESYPKFVALFDQDALRDAYEDLPVSYVGKKVVLYGEAYGGKQQGMSYLYGPELKFAVFDVKVGDEWMSVPTAEALGDHFDLEFVHYIRMPTTNLDDLDAERDKDSVQMVRNGVDPATIPEGKTAIREGVVLRPIIEAHYRRRNRICAKHKSVAFDERKKTPKIQDPAQMKILADANAIAEEWVTPMRLEHILDKLPKDIGMEDTPRVLHAMTADILREAKGEIVDSKPARSAICRATAILFKKHVVDKFRDAVASSE